METVLDDTTIMQNGERYGLARGADSYVIVDTSLAGSPTVATFPLSADGWFSARREIERLEQPVTPAPFLAVPQQQAPASMTRSSAIILAGVAIGAIGLFPSYLSGSSIASQGDLLFPHLVYLIGWATAGILLLSARQARIAAIASVGLSAMSFGFFVTDVGSAASSTGQSAGAGLYLALIGWAVCTGGSLAALLGTHEVVRDQRSWKQRFGVLGIVIPAAIVLAGTVVMFALPWDRYHIVAGATGQSQTFNVGNAFSNPGAVIVGEVVTMAAIVLLLGAALLWRPIVTGTALFVGALVPLVAQLFSALLQPAPALSGFGISQAVATQEQIHLSAGYTPWFYLYCAAIGLLVIAAGWLVSRAVAPKV